MIDREVKQYRILEKLGEGGDEGRAGFGSRGGGVGGGAAEEGIGGGHLLNEERGGDILVISLMPTGESQSSPVVWNM